MELDIHRVKGQDSRIAFLGEMRLRPAQAQIHFLAVMSQFRASDRTFTRIVGKVARPVLLLN